MIKLKLLWKCATGGMHITLTQSSVQNGFLYAWDRYISCIHNDTISWVGLTIKKPS